MKKIILNFEKKGQEFNELVQEAFNKDILNFLVSEETYPELSKVERVNLFSKNLDLECKNHVITDNKKLDQILQEEKKQEAENFGFFYNLTSKEDEMEIKRLSKLGVVDFIIVSAKDWKIIPFENLIAEMHTHNTELIAEVENVEEAELMINTLEMGVDGILITPKDANDIVDLKKMVYASFDVDITSAEVMNIQSIPESERVCVDTTSLLKPGEGMLVGSTARGFALVHAEVFETQFVASRPFRVNAGDVSAYILVPNDDPEKVYRTNYLSELKGGEKVLVANIKGNARIVTVGRVKIETRPMLRFELIAKKDNIDVPINIICQNAETIRLVDARGTPKSVVDIKVGDKVLVHIGPGATHFGTAIKETIIEK